MKNFDELQDQHEKLLGQESNGEDILEDVQAYIEHVRFESRNISSPQGREQLRANIRYWATYVFEKTNLYPNTELAPFSGERSVPNIINTLQANPLTAFGLIFVVGVIIIILVNIPALGSIDPPNTPTSTATSVPITDFTPPANLTVTPTPTATPTPVPTSTPTSTPAPTSTPSPTPTSTPPRIIINTQTPITQENTTEITSIASLVGHDGAVLHVAFSPDGRQLASVGADGTLRIWDLSFDEPPLILKVSQSGWTQNVTYSPDGRWIATAGNDRIVNIFNLSSQTLPAPQQDAIQSQPFAQFEEHKGFIFGLAFHPDSTKLASGSGDGDLKLWDIIAGGLITSIHLSDNAVLDLSFNSTGSLLAVANLDGGLWILDEELRSICQYPNESIIASVFSTNDDAVFVGNNKGQVIQIDSQTCQVLDRFGPELTEFVNSVAISPDGDIIVSGRGDNTLVLNPGNIQLLEHTDSVESVAFSPLGNLIASASADGRIILWGISEN